MGIDFRGMIVELERQVDVKAAYGRGSVSTLDVLVCRVYVLRRGIKLDLSAELPRYGIGVLHQDLWRFRLPEVQGDVEILIRALGVLVICACGRGFVRRRCRAVGHIHTALRLHLLL